MDRYYKWKHFKSFFGELSRITHKQSTWKYAEVLHSFMNRKAKDPFSNLIEISEMDLEAGLKSVCYIMTTEEKHSKNINDYSIDNPSVIKTIQHLIAVGVEIGIHPGILTYNSFTKMKDQKEKLEYVVEQPVTRSRQHYLKYEYPTTFRLLESIGIENDSSILVDLSKESDVEKRSTYSMFDSVNSSTTGITQTPLVFMDTHHMQLPDDKILNKLEESLHPAKRDGGEIMILWHNNNISNNREKGLYKEALEIIKN